MESGEWISLERCTPTHGINLLFGRTSILPSILNKIYSAINFTKVVLLKKKMLFMFFHLKFDLQISVRFFHSLITYSIAFEQNCWFSMRICQLCEKEMRTKNGKWEEKWEEKWIENRNPFDKFIICWKVFKKTYLQLFKCRFKVKEYEKPLPSVLVHFVPHSVYSFALVNIGINLMWILSFIYERRKYQGRSSLHWTFPVWKFCQNTFKLSIRYPSHTNRSHNYTIFSKMWTKILKAFCNGVVKFL